MSSLTKIRNRHWSWSLYLKKLQTRPQSAINDVKIAIAVSTINRLREHAAHLKEVA